MSMDKFKEFPQLREPHGHYRLGEVVEDYQIWEECKQGKIHYGNFVPESGLFSSCLSTG